MLDQYERLGDAMAADLQGSELLSLLGELTTTHRLCGSDEEYAAFQVVEKKLIEIGLSPRLIRHDAFVSLPVSASVTAGGTRLSAITHPFSATAPVEGLTASSLFDVDASDWNPALARDSIVIQSGLARGDHVRRNEAAGAAAQIFVGDEHPYEITCSPTWGSPVPTDLKNFPRTPIVTVNRANGEMIRTLAAAGKQIRIHNEVDTGWRQIPLMTVDIAPPGIDDLTTAAMPFVMLSGHIDSWYFGALDNGTAQAAMIAIARALVGRRSVMRRGLRLCFWSGHSQAKYAGSAWYADEYHEELERLCIAHVNIDSIGGRTCTVMSEGVSTPSTHDWGARAISAVVGASFAGSKVPRAGDQSFIQIGIPSLFLTLSEHPADDSFVARQFRALFVGTKSAGVGPWWHTPADTIDKIDPAFLERDAKIIALAIGDALASARLPIRPEEHVRALVGEIASAAAVSAPWLDLASVTRLAARLDEAVGHWLHRRAAKPVDDVVDVRKMLAFLRPVVELYHSCAGQFAHDTMALPYLPLLTAAHSLSGMEESNRNATVVSLRRNRNYVAARLRAAIAAADSA